MTREIKIVFTGPMGAGKTTAIAAISDIAPITTETANSDRDKVDKDSTTVALDYGEIALPDGDRVRLYGTPGQARFGFMWEILGEGALGVVLLLDASHPAALEELDVFIAAFDAARRAGTLVIGVGRGDAPGAIAATRFAERIATLGGAVPVFAVDVRRREDVTLLVETLLAQIEANAADPVSA